MRAEAYLNLARAHERLGGLERWVSFWYCVIILYFYYKERKKKQEKVITIMGYPLEFNKTMNDDYYYKKKN